MRADDRRPDELRLVRIVPHYNLDAPGSGRNARVATRDGVAAFAEGARRGRPAGAAAGGW